MKTSLYIALFVAFVDYMGVGLIYPLFSSMLFDSALPLLSPETSHEMRGLWLGLLLSLMPLAQFFSSPIWGALSDSKGRKKPLQLSLAIALFGYITAFSGVLINSIALLLASRVIIGFAAGNMSIVQATIADISPPNEKAKNFGLYSMALGVGFTLGPFFGGSLATWGYSIPFLFASTITALNLLFALIFFKESLHLTSARKLSWSMGLVQLQKAFRLKGFRAILLAAFLSCFGWSYFFEFTPVYLIARFHFTPSELGLFFGAAGGYYALSTGLLIRPFVRRFKAEVCLFGGMLLAALSILAMPLLPSLIWIWPLMFLICFFVAFNWPTLTTLVSNNSPPEIQGEALGVLASVNAAALVLSPLLSGSLVGAYPTLPMWAGGSVMLAGALILLAVFRRQLFVRAET